MVHSLISYNSNHFTQVGVKINYSNVEKVCEENQCYLSTVSGPLKDVEPLMSVHFGLLANCLLKNLINASIMIDYEMQNKQYYQDSNVSKRKYRKSWKSISSISEKKSPLFAIYAAHYFPCRSDLLEADDTLGLF